MPNRPRKLPHLYLRNHGKSERYTSSKNPPISPPPPERERVLHAEKLNLAIGQAIIKARQQLNSREPDIAVGEAGFYLEFAVCADKANVFENLEHRRKKVELVSVRTSDKENDIVYATVFVPETATEFFLDKVNQYRDQETKQGKPKNEQLIARVENVAIGTVQSLFTDDLSLFPNNEQEIWWEVWLRHEQLESFQEIICRLNLQMKTQTLSFPEREVVLVMANVQAIERIIKNSDTVCGIANR